MQIKSIRSIISLPNKNKQSQVKADFESKAITPDNTINGNGKHKSAFTDESHHITSTQKDKFLAETALNSIGDAVICSDINCNITYLNIAAEKLTGWTREEAIGKPINSVFNIINAVTRKPAFNPFGLVIQIDRPRVLAPDTVLIKRDGSEVPIEDSTAPIHDREGKLTGVVVVFHDVGAANAMAKKMSYSAQHDFLTNLPNRMLLNDRIAQAITLANRNQTQLAILFLDLDHFKKINDRLGHAIGDKLLQSVTKRLQHCVRESDTVSRQGGDEFAILLSEIKNTEDAIIIARKILDEMKTVHSFGKHQLNITISIGVSMYPTDGTDAETLLKSADTAMYSAKTKGRNNYQFFISDMNAAALAHLTIENNLKSALEKQQFTLNYQPKVNLASGEIIGAEALLRWQHDEWGEVLPNIFVPVAEVSGLIVPIGRWVMREACLQIKRWQKAGTPDITVAVNISAQEFLHKDFVEGVRATLIETRLAAEFLELEIAESILMHDAECSMHILQQLKQIGVKLVVDDFGTGYSSLSYLQRFPIDGLKIDQSFVQNIASANDDGTVVNAIICMSNSLKLKVVAEGIETLNQFNFLKSYHCEQGQGFLFSHPSAADNFETLLSKKHIRVNSNQQANILM